jgi:hypothetical protein
MPTEAGRESAAERKDRQAEEFNEAQVAHYAIVGRLRPTNMKVRHEVADDVPASGGEVTAGELLVFELDLAGYGILDVQVPFAGALPIAHGIYELYKARQAQDADAEPEGAGAKLITSATEADVKKAAAQVAAAEQLREGK